MRGIAKRFPRDPGGENPLAVRLFRRLDAARDLIAAGPVRRRLQRHGDLAHWPPLAGDYRVGDANASVAVCTLSSRDLIEPVSRLLGVAIAGRLITVNLGIERLVTNVVANPRIRARLAAGGHREPVGDDPRGFFIITLDTEAGEIVCQHYAVDHTPAHEIRSRSAERILLGLLRAELVSKLSHAGYLGSRAAQRAGAAQPLVSG